MTIRNAIKSTLTPRGLLTPLGLKTAILYGLVLVVVSIGAKAASFDCEKAKSEVEKLICSEPNLSHADEELDRTYRAVLHNRPRDKDKIIEEQRRWLAQVRDACRDAACLQKAYVYRAIALSSQDPFNITYEGPVRIEDLGKNWQFTHDVDKLPVIRRAIAGRKVVPPSKDSNKAPICKTFLKDLIAGREVESIEPEMQVLDRKDARLGGPLIVSTGGKPEYLDRDDPRVGRWHRCDGTDASDSTANSYERVFQGLTLAGLPPYRFYRIKLDLDSANGPEDVVLYRQRDSGYTQLYAWVDLDGCEIRGWMGTASLREKGAEYKDTLSLMIRYKGKAMVLSYQDWSTSSEPQPKPALSLQSISTPELCLWQDPRLSMPQ